MSSGQTHGGKGSTTRPTDTQKYADNYDAIFGKKTREKKLIETGWTPPHADVNRVEVIDKTGRAYTHYLRPCEKVKISLQDANQTMKIFIDEEDYRDES